MAAGDVSERLPSRVLQGSAGGLQPRPQTSTPSILLFPLWQNKPLDPAQIGVLMGPGLLCPGTRVSARIRDQWAERILQGEGPTGTPVDTPDPHLTEPLIRFSL